MVNTDTVKNVLIYLRFIYMQNVLVTVYGAGALAGKMLLVRIV